jgi:hypothetical protein
MGGDMGQNAQTTTPQNQDDSQVTPAEQAEYDDFVTRAKLFINDPRVPQMAKGGGPRPGAKAPRDVIIDHLNIKGLNAADAVGRTTGEVAWIIYQNAAMQKHAYSPDVLYHGADEIMSDLYQIGVASGVIKNPPPDGSVEEEHLLGLAKLAAVKNFGQNLIRTGQANSQEAQQYYLEQIKREGDSGELDKWDPSQQFTPAQLQDFMRKAAQGELQAKDPMAPPRTTADFAAMGHPQLVPPDGAAPPAGAASAPAPPPDQAAAAPPPDAAASPPDAAAPPPPGGM